MILRIHLEISNRDGEVGKTYTLPFRVGTYTCLVIVSSVPSEESNEVTVMVPGLYILFHHAEYRYN